MDPFRPGNGPFRTGMGPLRPWMSSLRPEMGPPNPGMGPIRPWMGPPRPVMDPLMSEKGVLRSGKGLLGPENWKRPSQARNEPYQSWNGSPRIWDYSYDRSRATGGLEQDYLLEGLEGQSNPQ